MIQSRPSYSVLKNGTEIVNTEFLALAQTCWSKETSTNARAAELVLTRNGHVVATTAKNHLGGMPWPQFLDDQVNLASLAKALVDHFSKHCGLQPQDIAKQITKMGLPMSTNELMAQTGRSSRHALTVAEIVLFVKAADQAMESAIL